MLLEVLSERSEVISAQTNHKFGVPNIGKLNIDQSSQVHIGPEYKYITQNINNIELFKGDLIILLDEAKTWNI